MLGIKGVGDIYSFSAGRPLLLYPIVRPKVCSIAILNRLFPSRIEQLIALEMISLDSGENSCSNNLR